MTAPMRPSRSSGAWSPACRRAMRYLLPLVLLAILCTNVALVAYWLRNHASHEPVPTTSTSSWGMESPEGAKTTTTSGSSTTNTGTALTIKGSPQLPLATIGHVVSLIKCAQTAKVTGFLDAAAVLRHSIHQQSYHTTNPISNTPASKYSYQMYAILHEDCQTHAPLLQKWGYTPLIRPSPIRPEEIQGDFLQKHVEQENCCGSKEFIKLYAYQLTQHPIVVHWDLDVAILQPMDDLFDSMLFPHDSVEGQEARARLELQHPSIALPERIDAFLTRDITSSQPWEPVQGVQGGFLVARPRVQDFDLYIDIIREGNYTRGRGPGTGWGSLGYGGFQGAMAYQGIVAYFYDVYRPNTAVELNVCRWNQVVADVIWRGPRAMQHHMQCREYPKDGNYETNTQCEDCRVTPVELVKTVHYTACKKPWECTVPHPRKSRNPKDQYRLNHLTNITTCGKLFRKWFELRKDFEGLLERKAQVAPSARNGKFEPDSFLGYCNRPGGYIAMNPPPESMDMSQLYDL